MSSRFYAGAFLVISLTIIALAGWGYRQRELKQEAEAKLLASDLELAGAHTALRAKPKEVVKFIEVPAAIKAAVKSGVVAPIAAIKAVAKSDVIEIPCPNLVDDSGTTGIDIMPDNNTVTSTAPVWFELNGNLFIGQIKHGEALWTGTLDGHVHSGEFQAPIDFAPENIDFKIVVNEEIGKAVDFYGRSWLRKHTALSCPGVGITYNPLNERSVDVAITCGYSFVWF